jgi:electron transfer flavoprotein beta subunit
MNIVVALKMVPDVVEELEVAGDGRSLDTEFLRLIVSEGDDRALEQALLLKDRHGGTVTAIAPDAPEVDDLLFASLAKGADRVVKITDIPGDASTRRVAAILAAVLPAVPGLDPPDVVLTGCQAIDDLDGLVAPLLAADLGLPYVGLVSRITADPGAGKADVVREYSGGVLGEFEVALPALFGVQGSESPPRYVPVAKVRAAMAEGGIEEVAAVDPGDLPMIEVASMAPPETGEAAEIIEGSVDEVADALADVLTQRGLL